ncbi:MAG: hypothetical protein AABX51_02650 [Nanoarchaeota archaeon]
MVESNRIILGSLGQEWEPYQRILGFDLDVVCLDGLSAEKIIISKTANSRATNKKLGQKIRDNWQLAVEQKAEQLATKGLVEIRNVNGWQEVYFDGERVMYNGEHPRLEGTQITREGSLELVISSETYAANRFFFSSEESKTDKANLIGVNGITLTNDGFYLTGLRTQTVDYQIESALPAGLIDIISTQKKSSYLPEHPANAVAREFGEELISPVQPSIADPKLLGIVYDDKTATYTCSFALPINVSASQISLPQTSFNEHTQILTFRTDYDSLVEKLASLAINRESTSSHLRGDIALLIGHLYPGAFLDGMIEAAIYVEPRMG